MATLANMGWHLHNMKAGGVEGGGSDPDPVVIHRTQAGITLCAGNTKPTGANYAPGCVFIHHDGSSTDYLYVNNGTVTTADFEKVVDVNNVLAQIETEHLSGTAAGRGPSPLIWNSQKVLQILLDPTLGHHYFNDFMSGPVGANNSSDYTGGEDDVIWATGATAGSVITPQTDEPTGVIQLASTTDNEGAVIACLAGGNVSGNFLPSRTWAFEARIKTKNITDSKYNEFIGFAEEALCADGSLIANTDAMADKDYFGFQRVFADGDKLDTVYNTAGHGSTPVTIQADAVTVAADTWHKVGAKCDGTTITFYADGVALSTTVALSATGFPNDQEMAFYFGIMLGHGDDASAEIDWVRIVQEY